MAPVTGGLIVKVAAVTVAGFTGSLKVAVRAEEIDTSMTLLAGVVAVIERELLFPTTVVPVPGEPPSQERSTEATMSPNAA